MGSTCSNAGAMFTDRHGILLGIGATVVTLAAVAASIIYWRLTGLLTP